MKNKELIIRMLNFKENDDLSKKEKSDYNLDHNLNEMARVDDPHHDDLGKNIEIWVYSEKDKQGYKEPHFHIKGEDFEFEIYIRHIHNLDIWRTKWIKDKSNAGTWNGRADIRKAVTKWLDEANTEFAPLSNAHTIVAQWNSNNSNNKIPQSWKN